MYCVTASGSRMNGGIQTVLRHYLETDGDDADVASDGISDRKWK